MKLAVIGDGQLALLLTHAFINMKLQRKLPPDAEIWVISTAGEKCPAFAAGAKIFVGDYKNPADIERFISEVQPDRLTAEITHFPIEAVEKMTPAGRTLIQPSVETFRTMQDKFALKMCLSTAGVPVTEFAMPVFANDYRAICEAFGDTAFILKTRGAAYDGKGVAKITSEAELRAAVERFGAKSALYAEKLVNVSKELSVIVVAGEKYCLTYPVTSSIQKNNTCHITETPADIPPALMKQAEELALAATRPFTGTGTFVVDMFLSADDKLIVNGVTPRVDNTCHYTIDSCVTSAYRNHIRAIFGMELGPTHLIPPQYIFGLNTSDLGVHAASFALMVNILGEAEGEEGQRKAEELMVKAKMASGTVVWYGKDPKPGRKLGHIVFHADTRESARSFLRSVDPQSLALMPRISDRAVTFLLPPPTQSLQQLAASSAPPVAEKDPAPAAAAASPVFKAS